MKRYKWAGIFLLILSTTGCSSVITRAGEYDKYYVYPGVRSSADQLSNHNSTSSSSSVNPLLIIDLPFSFILDTVLLPADAIIYSINAPE
ncbi:YceK/YidQ family lipoprotein [Enterobacter sp.]|uniref:YceK/YidQ family lipoprotein n=1 Tax=Enterobacter sp. TaxID=42895 RepID=UPI00296E86B5|nr:YceK/YidQ family lipoprotein [Enterobacter sp.]